MGVSVGERKRWLSGTVVLVCLVAAARPLRHGLTPPGTEKLTALFPHVAFDDVFSDFYGGKNVRRVENGSAVNLVLDKLSGCGIRSKHMFYHGFFSAAVKLPSGFTAGVVLAFYAPFGAVVAVVNAVVMNRRS